MADSDIHQVNVETSVPTTPPQIQPPTTSGLAIAGMVIGIIALLASFAPVIHLGAFILGIVGLALAIAGLVAINTGKKRGKGIAIAGIVTSGLSILLAVLVIGSCSALANSARTTSASSGSSAQSAQAASVFVGTWDAVAMVGNGENANREYFERSRAQGKDTYLMLREDGSALLMLDGEKFEGAWKPDQQNKAQVTLLGKSYALTIKNDTLTMKVDKYTLTLERGQERPAEQSPSQQNQSQEPADQGSSAQSGADNNSNAAPNQDPTGVSADLKDFLDSYEAFVDEYVQFMQEYKSSSNAASMLSRYSSMMRRYSEFATALEKYNTDEMSQADAAYYLEVMARVNEKLATVLS